MIRAGVSKSETARQVQIGQSWEPSHEEIQESEDRIQKRSHRGRVLFLRVGCEPLIGDINSPWKVTIQSCRSARIGSTRIARWAGT